LATAATGFDITLNGEPYRLDGPTSLAALLERLGVHPQTVAVEHNRDIVRRDRLASTLLGPGDTVEVVRMIGGG
jgi:thiamine biosynthesis protein ThiS